MPNKGDVVLYTSQGRSRNALVWSARSGEVSHAGRNGEPTLTLVLLAEPLPTDPHKRPKVLQADTAAPEVEIEHDVVHASHEFSPEFKEKNGILTAAQIATQRGHGEWSEIESPKPAKEAGDGEKKRLWGKTAAAKP